MKRFITILIAIIIGLGVGFAKSDYSNPVESEIVTELVIQPAPNKTNVYRKMFIAVDSYDNHFISINVNYFYKKGKDDIQITLKDGSEYRIKLEKSIKVKAYSFYPEIPSYNVTTTVSTVGNYTTANTTITKQKYDYYDFYSIYVIPTELYEAIKEVGIEDMKVEGIYQITLK